MNTVVTNQKVQTVIFDESYLNDSNESSMNLKKSKAVFLFKTKIPIIKICSVHSCHQYGTRSEMSQMQISVHEKRDHPLSYLCNEFQNGFFSTSQKFIQRGLLSLIIATSAKNRVLQRTEYYIFCNGSFL